MRKLLVALAILAIPSLASATDYYVRRNGCFYRATVPTYHAPVQHAPAVSKSAAEIGAGLLLKAEEYKFLRETAAQAFGTPSGASYSYGSYNVQRGNTSYGPAQQSGYSLQSFQTITPQPLDVEALMERATRLATSAQDNGAAATAQAQGLLGQAQAGQQAIAQTFAQAARELSVIQALKPVEPQQVQTQTQFHATASASSGQAEADAPLPNQAASVNARYQSIVTKSCVSCHDAESPAGGLNLAGDVAALDKERRYAMMLRVTSDDPKKRMPLDHPPLSDSDQMVFVKATLD